MSTKETTPTNTNLIEQFTDANANSEKDKAWKEARKSEKRGKRLASHVVKMLETGKADDRAKMGRFPNRYPYYGVAEDSVTMATNAELRAIGKNVMVDVYNSTLASSDPDPRLNVAITSIDGQELPPQTDEYKRELRYREQRAQREQEAAEQQHAEQ